MPYLLIAMFLLAGCGGVHLEGAAYEKNKGIKIDKLDIPVKKSIDK